MNRVKKKSKASKKPKSGRKQASKTASAKTLGEGSTLEPPPAVRFSATVHASEQTARALPNWMDTLEIDRVPDPSGLVRALLTPVDCVRLVNQGFEVRLYEAYPVKPLDPALIESEDSFKTWLDQKLQTFKRATRKQKGSKGA